MDSPRDFPLDSAFEILTRTSSLPTLDACKLICREWNELILHAPDFMSKYCKNTNNIYGFFLQDYQKPFKHAQKFVSLEPTKFDEKKLINHEKFSYDDDIKIEASSKQGILCVVGRRSGKDRFYVGKPATGQWRPLPNPKFRFFTQKVALAVLGSNPFRFKIIRLSQGKIPRYTVNRYRYHSEIFDSRTWEWSSTEDLVLPNEVFLVNKSQPVQVGNLVHWLTTDHHVVVFNCEDEAYNRFPLPEMNYCNHSLIEYEGKLGFLNSTEEENTQVWVMDDSTDHSSWRLENEIEVEASLRNENAKPGGLYNRGIALLLSKASGRIVLYKLQDSSIHKSFKVNSPVFEHVFQFRSDLEPVNFRGE